MERIYAFIDEYGQFGWDLGKPDVSSSFIITAIIVKECDLTKYTKGAEEIRQRFFQTGEIKSSKVANDSNRRKRILSELSKLPFKIFTIVINKQEYLDNVNIQGLQYKRTFYKYMNNIVHRELRLAFDTLTIMADEIGTNDYMASFCRYVENDKMPQIYLAKQNLCFKKVTMM